MAEYNPDWEQHEYINLDRTWHMVEWLYINPDANDAPQFVAMCCSFDEFSNSVHDALKGPGDFWEYFGENHREYCYDRHSEEFDEMCDFIENHQHDIVIDKVYEDSSMIWTVMRVFNEVYNEIGGD